jgi:hypothetical protein
MALLDRLSPAQIYQLVAGFLKRVQPDNPPYPVGGRGRKPLLSEPGALTLAIEAAVGGHLVAQAVLMLTGRTPESLTAEGGVEVWHSRKRELLCQWPQART